MVSRRFKRKLKAFRLPVKKPQLWSPDCESMLALLWDSGLTCNQISESFKAGGFNLSRNAVSAKVKRLRDAGVGLAWRGTPIFKKGIAP